MNSPNAGGGFSGIPPLPSVQGGRGKGLNRGPGRPGTRKTSRAHRSPSQNGNKESSAPNRSPLSRPNKRPEENRTRFGGEPPAPGAQVPGAPGAPGNQQPRKSRVNKKIAKVVRKTKTSAAKKNAKKNAKKSVKRTTPGNKKTSKRILRAKKGHAGK